MAGVAEEGLAEYGEVYVVSVLKGGQLVCLCVCVCARASGVQP